MRGLTHRAFKGCPGMSTLGRFMYAEKRADGFIHVQPGPVGVRMCGVRDADIVRVEVRPAPDDAATPRGWMGAGHDRPSMIWPSFRQLDLCVPGGIAAAERRGRGRRAARFRYRPMHRPPRERWSTFTALRLPGAGIHTMPWEDVWSEDLQRLGPTLGDGQEIVIAADPLYTAPMSAHERLAMSERLQALTSHSLRRQYAHPADGVFCVVRRCGDLVLAANESPSWPSLLAVAALN